MSIYKARRVNMKIYHLLNTIRKLTCPLEELVTNKNELLEVITDNQTKNYLETTFLAAIDVNQLKAIKDYLESLQDSNGLEVQKEFEEWCESEEGKEMMFEIWASEEN